MDARCWDIGNTSGAFDFKRFHEEQPCKFSLTAGPTEMDLSQECPKKERTPVVVGS